jgi:hypothetical protein
VREQDGAEVSGETDSSVGVLVADDVATQGSAPTGTLSTFIELLDSHTIGQDRFLKCGPTFQGDRAVVDEGVVMMKSISPKSRRGV